MTGPSFSYWEQETYFDRLDVTIVGAGIVGLSTALNLLRNDPSLRVLVLERGILPTGASTKNAGFACFGSLSELIDDLGHSSLEEILHLVERRFRGLRKLRENLGDDAISYEPLGGYELFESTELAGSCLDRMAEFNRLLKPITELDETYLVKDDLIERFGFGETAHLVLNQAEGQIHTGKMIASLHAKVLDLGAKVLTGVAVESLDETDRALELVTNIGKIQSKQVLVATNGFARQLLPELEVQPARAQVLITEPVENLPFQGSFHLDRGYYYFRNVGNRILFGGGRNLDYEGETTTELGLTARIQGDLDQKLNEIIAPGLGAKVSMRWSGIMGMGSQKTTLLKRLGPHLSCAVRMGGMGVALGSLIGEEAAQLVLSSTS